MFVREKLRQKCIVPPGGYFYTQPETNFRIDAPTFDKLINRVIEHRTYKEIMPILRKRVALQVEDQICARIGQEHKISE